ncbi:RNA-directed DNA polymerase [Tanacetum coccineum]
MCAIKGLPQAPVLQQGVDESPQVEGTALAWLSKDWLTKATNWARFSATNGLGAIRRGHLDQQRSLMAPPYFLQHATHRIKQGSFLIEGNKFKIPLIYAFDMNDSNEGDEITIYKKATRIKTSNQTEVVEVAITELEVSVNDVLTQQQSQIRMVCVLFPVMLVTRTGIVFPIDLSITIPPHNVISQSSMQLTVHDHGQKGVMVT